LSCQMSETDARFDSGRLGVRRRVGIGSVPLKS
jgi:hypothetical protein